MGNIDMKLIEDIEKRACKELDKLYEKKDWGPPEFNILHQLTGVVKNTMKIMEHSGGYAMNGRSMNGYAQAGRWMANGTMEGEYGYNDGYSGQGHWVKGHYSRNNMPGGESGNYSNHSGNVVKGLEEMMEGATSRERDVIKRCIREIRDT